MPPEDVVRLQHMLDAAEKALRFIEGRRRGDLDADEMLALALARSIEIIGEAASRMGPETREAIPGIPWPAIIGMRNRLAHAYFDVNLNIVWKTAFEEIPAFLPILREALWRQPPQ